MRDAERVERIQQELKLAQLDALVCALPIHVLLLSGYWPVIGVSLAIVTSEGATILLVPEDERELTVTGWADEVHTFQPSPLSRLVPLETAVAVEWRKLAGKLGLDHARIGYESGPVSEPASYVAVNLYGPTFLDILQHGSSDARFVAVDEMLAKLMSVKTRVEVDHIRDACRVAQGAFTAGKLRLRAGVAESEAANTFRSQLNSAAANRGPHRADGFVFCMSGPNSAKAAGAYARSRERKLTAGDLVLVHCNSCVDGHWTDITRTYTLGAPEAKQRQLYEAVFEARQAALETIAPGVEARSVDEAARSVLAAHGFREEFKHSTGHGVGFAAISANARPQIHPASRERLDPGMVFNVEPAVYLDEYGGVRQCDMVVVTGTGYELLTPFQTTADELQVPL
jgi:Xaa-Pro aminopeptidase